MNLLVWCSTLLLALGAAEPTGPPPPPPRPWEGRLARPSGLVFDRHRCFVADTDHHRILVFRNDFSFARSLEGGALQSPRGLALTREGNLAVADSGHRRVLVLSPTGDLLQAFGDQGSGPGRLLTPVAVAVDDGGQFIVADRGAHRLVFFSAQGEFLATYGTRGNGADQFEQPAGVALTWLGARRALLVADRGNARVCLFVYDEATRGVTPYDQHLVGLPECESIASDGRQLLALRAPGELVALAPAPPATTKIVFRGGVFDRLHRPGVVAISPSGRVGILDTGNNRLLVLESDGQVPSPPRVTVLSESSAAIEWTTRRPVPSALTYARAGSSETLRAGASELKTSHRLLLTQLRPATAYRFRVHYAGALVIPGGPRSMEFQFATRPRAQQVIALRLPVALVAYTNVVRSEHRPPDRSRPGRPPPALGQHIREEIEKARMFFWINSGLRLLLEVEIVLVDRPLDLDANAAPDTLSGRRELEALLVARGHWSPESVITGTIACERRWRPLAEEESPALPRAMPGELITASPRGIWYYAREAPGDIAGQLVRAWHHKLRAHFLNSGLPADPDHYGPSGLPAHHGELLDAIAWNLRHWPCQAAGEHLATEHSTRGQCARLNGDAFFRHRAGTVVAMTDTDEDGVPDDFPLAPLDEARFGSDPTRRDSDDDGLDDRAEAMTSTWVHESMEAVSNARARRVLPNPLHPDADGDGVPDGRDPYPLYAVPTEFKAASPSGPGGMEGWRPFVVIQEERESEPLHLQSWLRWDAGSLGLRLLFNRPVPALHLQIDANNDGYRVGADNLELRVQNQRGRATLTEALLTVNTPGLPPQAVPAPGRDSMAVRSRLVRDGWEVELILPKNDAVGLRLRPGQWLGVRLEVLATPDTDHWLSAFEPYTLMQLRLIE